MKREVAAKKRKNKKLFFNSGHTKNKLNCSKMIWIRQEKCFFF